MNRNYITYLFLTISCLFLGTKANGQSDSIKISKKDFSFSIGINISDPLLSVLRKKEVDSNRILSPNVYASFGYKKFHLRAGFGGTIRQKNNRSDLASNVSEEHLSKFSITASALYRSKINDNLSIYTGLYFWNAYHLDQTTYDSGFDLTTHYNESIGYAAGPGAMLEYHIGKRISIFTEYNVLFRTDFGYDGRTFSAFPNDSYKKHASTTYSVSFDHPISIFLNYKF